MARGTLDEDSAYYTGKDAKGDDIDAFPIAVDKAFIQRGRQRYDIYCTPCHGAIGNGLGMIVRRGFQQPPSYHIDRLRNAPVGHFYDVITNGYGAMLNYAQQVQPRDRWAIVAYIRALQYSQNANINDLPTEARGQGSGAGQLRRRAEQQAAQRVRTAGAPRTPISINFPARASYAVRCPRRDRRRRSKVESAREKMTTTEHSYATAPQLSDALKRYSFIATFIGLVFLALTVAGIFLVGMEQFLRSYLVGFWFWFGAGAGCLLILMTQFLSGGAWGLIIRRPLEAGAKTLYVMVLLFSAAAVRHEASLLVDDAGRLSRQGHSRQASLPECSVPLRHAGSSTPLSCAGFAMDF